MCQLTDSRGDFWRRIYTNVSEPVRFAGYVLRRNPDVQALYETQGARRADAAVRKLRALEADDKVVFDALESVPFAIAYRRPHLRAALADAYRKGDHAELGRIVADEMRMELEEKAEDAASDECEELEFAELRELERSAV